MFPVSGQDFGTGF